MKKIFAIILLLLSMKSYAQLNTGDAVPDIKFNHILNAPVKSASLSQLKGKIVVIEFWATWCGSCLNAMPHLKTLQQQYPGNLQVITVSDETLERVGRYLSVKPSNLWFAVDSGEESNNQFPHQLIPHTIVIAPDGTLIAATSPEFVTNGVIDSILSGKHVHLPPKKDVIYSSIADLLKKTFPADDTIRHRFLMESQIPGAPGLSTVYLTDSTWHNRRLSAINCNLSTLYRIAYGNFPYERTSDKTGPGGQTSYCLDIIVENKGAIGPALKKELEKRFDIRATLKAEARDVYVLQIADTAKFKKIPLNTSGKPSYLQRHGEIDQQDMTMTDLAASLEDYGTSKGSVIDETGNKGKYDIKFSFQPENPESLTDALSGMGLRLIPATRSIDILYLVSGNQQ